MDLYYILYLPSVVFYIYKSFYLLFCMLICIARFLSSWFPPILVTLVGLWRASLPSYVATQCAHPVSFFWPCLALVATHWLLATSIGGLFRCVHGGLWLDRSSSLPAGVTYFRSVIVGWLPAFLCPTSAAVSLATCCHASGGSGAYTAACGQNGQHHLRCGVTCFRLGPIYTGLIPGLTRLCSSILSLGLSPRGMISGSPTYGHL